MLVLDLNSGRESVGLHGEAIEYLSYSQSLNSPAPRLNSLATLQNVLLQELCICEDEKRKWAVAGCRPELASRGLELCKNSYDRIGQYLDRLVNCFEGPSVEIHVYLIQLRRQRKVLQRELSESANVALMCDYLVRNRSDYAQIHAKGSLRDDSSVQKALFSAVKVSEGVSEKWMGDHASVLNNDTWCGTSHILSIVEGLVNGYDALRYLRPDSIPRLFRPHAVCAWVTKRFGSSHLFSSVPVDLYSTSATESVSWQMCRFDLTFDEGTRDCPEYFSQFFLLHSCPSCQTTLLDAQKALVSRVGTSLMLLKAFLGIVRSERILANRVFLSCDSMSTRGVPSGAVQSFTSSLDLKPIASLLEVKVNQILHSAAFAAHKFKRDVARLPPGHTMAALSSFLSQLDASLVESTTPSHV